MKNLQSVDVSNFSDTNDLKFRKFDMFPNWVDVYYKNTRIAIVNGFCSTLQWVAPNGSNIPNRIIDHVEKLVVVNLIKP